MELPLQISFHGLGPSDALRDEIRERAQKLERHGSHLQSCRVALELSAKHKHHGRQFSAHIVLKVRGGEIDVSRQQHEDAHIALRDAFLAAQRQLDEHVRAARGEVKAHTRAAPG
jgi:ribosomal subunit interface protein